MNDLYLREILQEYDEIQRVQSRALSLRREEVFSRIPDLAKIHSDIVELMAENSRKAILNPDNTSTLVSELQEQMARLKAKEMKLLKENGYPEDI